MARNTTITRDAVFTTADELAAQLGKAPTQAQVRDALGGGSFTTIGPHMKEWEAARAERAEARETSVPDTVQVALAEVAGRLWQVASTEAALGVEAARREVEDMRRDAAAEAAASAEAIQIVEGERDAALGQVEALTADLEGVRADLRGQIEARTRAETQTEAAAARADRADADRQVASEERAKIEAEAANLREAVATLRETVAQLTAERSGLTDQLRASNDRTAKAEARSEKAEAKAEAVQAELTKTAAELAGARADLAKERAEHGATRSQLSERLERLSVDHENAQERAKALAAELAEIRKSERE